MSGKATRRKSGIEGTFRDEGAAKQNKKLGKELAQLRDGSREQDDTPDSSVILQNLSMLKTPGEFFIILVPRP